MNFPIMPLAETIRAARELAGYTQKTLAILLDVSPQFLNDVEYGRRMPSVETLKKMAETLGIPFDVLCFYRGIIPPDLQQDYPVDKIIAAFDMMRQILEAK